MSMISRIISRLRRRRGTAVTLTINPARVDPAVLAQVMAGREYMRRYYAWLQEPVGTDDWATGGLIGGSDSIPSFISRRGHVTDRFGC